MLRVIIDSLCGVPPAADDALAVQLRVVCPRLGVKLVADASRTVSLQLLRCVATVQGSGEVAASVGAVSLAVDGDEAALVQVTASTLLILFVIQQ